MRFERDGDKAADNDDNNRCFTRDADNNENGDDGNDDQGRFAEGLISGVRSYFDEVRGEVEFRLPELKQCLPKCSTTRHCGPGFACSDEGVCRKVFTQQFPKTRTSP